MSPDAKIRYVQYSLHNSPGFEESFGEIVKMNCQTWVHFDLSTLGIYLPSSMRSKEIAEDEEVFFRTLPPGESVQRGDVYQFGKHKMVDIRSLHLATHSGYVTKETGEPILTHATVIDGSVSAWPVSWFAMEERYATLYAVKRPLALEKRFL